MDVTMTMLEKKPEELTVDEKIAVDHYRKWHDECIKEIAQKEKTLAVDCRTLLSGIEKRPIPDYGWIRPVEDLCYAIEALNIKYSRWGLSVVLDQAKEKFGTLRFYTHIETRDIGLAGFILRPVEWLIELLSKVDYGMKLVVDKPSYKTVEWTEIDKEKYDKGQDHWGIDVEKTGKEVVYLKSRDELKDLTETVRNTYFLEEDGKFFHTRTVHHTAERHAEFTKHPILRFFLYIARGLSFQVSYFLPTRSRKQYVMMKDLDNRVDKLVEEAERRCESICQYCGVPFEEGRHERCVTQGWYMYLCEQCAKTTGMTYRIGEKYFREGEQVEDENSGNGHRYGIDPEGERK